MFAMLAFVGADPVKTKEMINGRGKGKQMTQEISISGLWFAGWLFTIGYAKLTFGYGLLALLLWPYFLGSAIAH